MNYKELLKHQEMMAKTIVVPDLKEDGSNAKDFFCADVIGGKKFATNYGGYPRSDIAEINSQANVAIQQELLSRLNEFPVSDVTSGMTDIQIMAAHRSKYCQSPSEMQDWLMNQLQIRDSQRVSNSTSSVNSTSSDDTIGFTPDDNPPVNE